MSAENILMGRFRALLNESIIYNNTIIKTGQDKNQSIQNLLALKGGDPEAIRTEAKKVFEYGQMEAIMSADYDKILSVAKELKDQVVAISPDIFEKLTDVEKELFEFLGQWEPYLCSVIKGGVEIRNARLKEVLPKRIEELTIEDANQILLKTEEATKDVPSTDK